MILRRSFLSAFAGAFAVQPPTTAAQSTANTRWQPARDAQDDWLDQVPGKHRLIFDTTTPDGFGSALLFGNNFLEANKNAYGLEYSDVAVVIVVRHNSTPFAFNDAIWSKYGGIFAQRTSFKDPKTQQAPSANLFNATSYGTALTNFGMTLDSMSKRGVQWAVCRLATRNFAGAIASATAGDVEKINSELIENVVSNSHIVPAGIVAVNRAQERGYALATAG